MISINDIREKYTPEMALTILICRVYFNSADAAEINEYVAGNKIDWLFFEKIITAHQVRPVVYKVLSVHNAAIDSAFLDRLRNNCFKIAANNLQKLEELASLSDLFRKNDIKAIPYKGILLSQSLFGDFISRETVDIDFLIDPADFSEIRGLLMEQGYTSVYYNPAFEKQFLRTSHELQFSKSTPAGLIKIEIHWAVTNRMMDIPIPVEAIFKNSVTMNISATETEVFSLYSHLLVLLVHHGVNDVWKTLRHTVDIGLFLQKHSNNIDWNALHDATVKYRMRHTTEIGFLLTQHLFGLTVPGPFKVHDAVPLPVMDNLLMFPSLKKLKLNRENLSQQLFLRDSFPDKIRLLFSYARMAIVPNVRDMQAVPLSRNLYFLYYIIKPFRMLFRGKTKATAAKK
jgi:hypothetical protein